MEGTTPGPRLRLIQDIGAGLAALEDSKARHPATRPRAPRMRLVGPGQAEEDGWVSLTEPGGVAQAVSQSQAQPAAIVEYDGFGGLDPGEPDNVDYLATLAHGVARHGEAFTIWAQLAADVDQLKRFDDAYLGCTPNRELWHEHLADALGVTDQLVALRPDLRPFIQLDLLAWAERLQETGMVRTVDGSEGRHAYRGDETL